MPHATIRGWIGMIPVVGRWSIRTSIVAIQTSSIAVTITISVMPRVSSTSIGIIMPSSIMIGSITPGSTVTMMMMIAMR
jgi:hypothetical protein